MEKNKGPLKVKKEIEVIDKESHIKDNVKKGSPDDKKNNPKKM